VGFDFKPTQESDDESVFSDAAEELAEEFEEGLEVHDKEDGDKVFDSAEQEVGSYDEASVLEAMLSGRKNRKGGYVAPEEASSGAAEDDDDHRSSDVSNAKRKGRRRLAAKEEKDEGNYADNEHHGKSEVQPEGSGPGNDVYDMMDRPSFSNDNSGSVSKGDKQNGENTNPKKNKKNKKGTEKKTTVSTDQKSKSKADQKSTSKGKKQKVHILSSLQANTKLIF